jgi:hypothetical protein
MRRNAVWIRRSAVLSVKPAKDETVDLLMSSGNEIRVHGYCSDVIPYLEGKKYRPFVSEGEMKEHALGREDIWHSVIGETAECLSIEEACERFSFEHMAENCAWGDPARPEPVAYDLEWELCR